MINIGRLMNMYDIKAKQASDGATTFFYLDKGESADRVQKALSGYSYAFDVYKRGHYPAFRAIWARARAPGDLLLVAKPPYWVVGPEEFPTWANWLGVTHIWPVTFTPFAGGLKANAWLRPADRADARHLLRLGFGRRAGPRDRPPRHDRHPSDRDVAAGFAAGQAGGREGRGVGAVNFFPSNKFRHHPRMQVIQFLCSGKANGSPGQAGR